MNDRTQIFGHGLNPNTILLMILMALGSVSVKKLFDIGEAQAEMKMQIQNLERVVYSRE